MSFKFFTIVLPNLYYYSCFAETAEALRLRFIAKEFFWKSFRPRFNLQYFQKENDAM